MKQITLLALMVSGVILAALLAMPVAAAPGTAAVHTSRNPVNLSNLNPALKEDLYNLRVQERLAQFDLNVKKGLDTIAVLNKYQYNTSGLSGILSTITGDRQSLENALNAKDKNALSSVNKELEGLWKNFGSTLKTLLSSSVP